MSRPPDDATTIFETQRPQLLRLAYRMLGSISEAEDVVQDAWLRWQRADRADIQSPPAFLSRVVTRLCLDAMKSARARRETYFGTWLPEPIAEEPDEPLHDREREENNDSLGQRIGANRTGGVRAGRVRL